METLMRRKVTVYLRLDMYIRHDTLLLSPLLRVPGSSSRYSANASGMLTGALSSKILIGVSPVIKKPV